MSEKMTVTTGHGYGPVTMTFDFGLSADGLHGMATRVMVDGIGEVPVFAYAPNAGDARDEWNVERLMERLDGTEARRDRQPHWATPMEYVIVPANDREGLEIAARALREMYVSFDGVLDITEWEQTPKCDVCMHPEGDEEWCGEHGNHADCCGEEH